MPPTLLDRIAPSAYALPEPFAAGVLSPALVVYLDRVRDNLASMLRSMDGDPARWRPHVKTTKIPAVFRELVRAGVRHFKCATTREADHLLRVLDAEDALGADLLVAYPLVGPALERLGRLARAHPRTRVSVLCEDPEAIASLPANLDVFVDVNPGMNRTGVPLADAASIHAVAARAGARFAGVHYYDGHLHEGGFAQRRESVFACYEPLVALLHSLARQAIEVREVVTSGTPTFQHALEYPGFRDLEGTRHRVSPGTVVYHDLRSAEENETLELVPAALVFARVISHPAPGIVTCDAGSKSIAAEAGDPCALALGHPGLVALSPSEEHLPFSVTQGEPPPRGTGLLLFPRHVCPTINLAEEAILVEGGEVQGVVPVSARGHELRPDD